MRRGLEQVTTGGYTRFGHYTVLTNHSLRVWWCVAACVVISRLAVLTTNKHPTRGLLIRIAPFVLYHSYLRNSLVKVECDTAPGIVSQERIASHRAQINLFFIVKASAVGGRLCVYPQVTSSPSVQNAGTIKTTPQCASP